MQAKFCMNCGAEVLPGKKFCMNCGTAAEAAPAPLSPVSQNQYVEQPAWAQPQPERVRRQREPSVPSDPGDVKSPGMLGYLGYLLLMSLPIAGLVISIIWSVKPIPALKSALPKAMIAFNVIWSMIFIAFLIFIYSVISQVANISVNIFGLQLL